MTIKQYPVQVWKMPHEILVRTLLFCVVLSQTHLYTIFIYLYKLVIGQQVDAIRAILIDQ